MLHCSKKTKSLSLKEIQTTTTLKRVLSFEELKNERSPVGGEDDCFYKQMPAWRGSYWGDARATADWDTLLCSLVSSKDALKVQIWDKTPIKLSIVSKATLIRRIQECTWTSLMTAAWLTFFLQMACFQSRFLNPSYRLRCVNNDQSFFQLVSVVISNISSTRYRGSSGFLLSSLYNNTKALLASMQTSRPWVRQTSHLEEVKSVPCLHWSHVLICVYFLDASV